MEAAEIVLTGGGSKSRTWCQIVADVCDLPVTLLEQDEGASFGAALQALWILERRENAATGIEDITAEHLSRQPGLSRVPNRANVDRYQESYAAYLQAVRQLAPLFEKTSGVTQ
jgi:xylulokinase